MPRLTIEGGQRLAADLLQARGYAPTDAAYIADHLIACDIDGLPALGLRRLTLITELLRKGYTRGNQTTVTRRSDTTLTVDGGGSIGYLTTRECVDWALSLDPWRGSWSLGGSGQ